MCQGWDTSKRLRQHGPGEYFDTDMKHSLGLYSRNIGGVVVALILRTKATQVQPTWLLLNNPTGAPNASTPAFCFPLGYVMMPALPPRGRVDHVSSVLGVRRIRASLGTCSRMLQTPRHR